MLTVTCPANHQRRSNSGARSTDEAAGLRFSVADWQTRRASRAWFTCPKPGRSFPKTQTAALVERRLGHDGMGGCTP